MLNVLKITQHLTPDVWKYVPRQDFTDKSDIDWSVSIANIDKQMLEYNMVVNDSVNEIDVFNNLPTGYIAPEERRKVIQADRTVPVKNIQEKFIASIRTGGIF